MALRHNNIAFFGFSGTSLIFKKVAHELTKKNVNCFHILPSYHYLHNFSDELANGKALYLYENLNSQLSQVSDAEQIYFDFDAVDKIFATDKSDYSICIPGDLKRKICLAKFKIYKDFFNKNKIQAVVFPDAETVDGVLLINICKLLGIEVVYYVNNRLFSGSFWAQDQYETLPEYFGKASEQHLSQAREFIAKYKTDHKWSSYPKGREPVALCEYNISTLEKAINFFKYKYGIEKHRYDEDRSLLLKILMKISNPYNKLRKKFFNLCLDQYFLKKADFSQKYVLLMLQYTPESSINGLQPYFVDQVRLIETLAFNLPKDVKLFVKEHPAMIGVRKASFYKRILSYVNVELIHPSCSSVELVQNSLTVATVTGTVGLEAFLVGKKCIQFGPNYFSHLNDQFKGFTDLKKYLQSLQYQNQTNDENSIIKNAAQILAISKPFFVFEPSFHSWCLGADNISAISESLIIHLQGGDL